MADPLVVDTSAVAGLLLGEPAARKFWSMFKERPMLAPELIRYELANTFLTAKRRKPLPHLSKIPISGLLNVAHDFPAKMVPLSVWWGHAARIAEKHDLTFYDAAYVGTAAAFKIPLCTMDGQILRVLKAERIEAITA